MWACNPSARPPEGILEEKRQGGMKRLVAIVPISAAILAIVGVPASADSYYGVNPQGDFMRLVVKKNKARFITTGPNEMRVCFKGQVKRQKLPRKSRPTSEYNYKYYKILKGKMTTFVDWVPARSGYFTYYSSANTGDGMDFSVTINKFGGTYWPISKRSFEKQFGGPLLFSQCG